MITQVADFGGDYRLPTGVAPADVAAAIRQLDEALLSELFTPETAALIAATPAAPPAATLQNGAGGMISRWRDVSLPWAPLRIHWGVVGSGTQVAKTKGVQGPIAGHIGYAKATRQLNEYRRQLTDVAAQHWHGEATVTAITPTSVTVTLPVPSWEWLSAGVPVRITNIALGYNTDAQVVSTTAPNTADISASGYPGSIGDTVRFSIQLKLKTQPSEYIWV